MIAKADSVWMMLCTLLVMLMIAPGLALFYGGLVRSKNVLSVLTQVLVVACLALVLWAVYGYSLAFTDGGAVIGGFGSIAVAEREAASRVTARCQPKRGADSRPIGLV